ncbi:MAG: TonB-dependent receptor [Phenylobacterium sp.]|uniref:TonB-dependent receptor n=1 Tax=Phenylobacterium sp. TaxID=1871053 RepID=UPI00273262D8|nr:TonB-dependent receptor [Phenylobacterium sp.]MDP3748098.1 TonB-dependent receptor [Phenylobacterium sp.]
MSRISKRLLFASALLTTAMLSTQAGAQQLAANDVDEVIVTGSRIKREDITGVGPATVVSQEQIARAGITNVEALLQRLPASAGAAGNQTNAYWTGNGYGTAQVNLRGLGINRTLTLINGRRVVNGGTGANSAPDLNMIPTAIIGRMDVLKDGASAIYGADAVAGVVNIVTLDKYQGLKLSAKYGVTDESDGGEYNVDVLWGLRGERGGVTAALTYQKTEVVNLASRAPCGLGEVGGALVCVSSASTIGGRAVLNGQQINFNQTPGGNGNFFEPYSAAKHNFNSNPFLNAVSPLERISTAFLADYELTDKVSLFAEFFFTHRESNQIATPGTLRNLAISATNPTNPTGQNITVIQRRLAEPGPRQFFQETDTYRFVGGAKGSIVGDWTWEAAVNWGRNTGIDGMTNIANKERVNNTLNTAICSAAAGATIPCADYLGAGDVTQQVLDYILFTSRDSGGNEQRSVTADVTGTVFQLPAGPLLAAAGLVYRDEEGWRNPDALTVLGIANTNQQDPISGKTKAKEAYLELSAPLLADLPMVRKLELDGAVRYSDYDLFGSNTTYKVGLNWTVIDSLRLRATFGTGFRIPSVPELFGGVAEGNLTTTDPCSRYSTSGNATLIANCQASGVPAGYVQLGNTVLTTVGGNQNLQPETAETLTLGLVWQPTQVSGLSVTVDYFDIKIKDAIRSIPGSTKLAVCYAAPGLTHPFCGPANFTRSSLTGEVNFLSAQPSNAGMEQMKGVDVGVRYDFDIGERRASLDWNTTYLDEYVITPFLGADPIEFDGHIGGGNGGYPHWRSNASFSVMDERWTGTYSVQWIGKATDFNAAPADIGYRAPNVFYHNAQFAYRLGESADIAVGVDNIFDKKAPFIKSWTDGNTDTMTYDLLGRRGYVRLTYQFN